MVEEKIIAINQLNSEIADLTEEIDKQTKENEELKLKIAKLETELKDLGIEKQN